LRESREACNNRQGKSVRARNEVSVHREVVARRRREEESDASTIAR
jgi:hypothetical protein